MAIKKTVVTQVGSALGAAAARVETLRPKRTSTAKHTKSKAPMVEAKVEPETSEPEQITAPQLSEHEDIEITAYLYAEARGFQGGSPDEDWVRAEREVRERRAAKA